MNATAMGSLDATGAAGKARGPAGAGAGEPAAAAEDNPFAGLMGASTPPAAASTDAGATDAPDEPASEAAESEPSCETDDAACSAQVMALLGLSPPPVASQAMAASAAALGPALPAGQRATTPDAVTTAIGEGTELLSESLRPTRAASDLRSAARAPGVASLEPPTLLLPTGSPGGLDPRPADAMLPQSLLEPTSGTLGDTLRTLGAALSSTPAASAPPASPPAAAPLQHPVGTQAWNDELGARLAMLVDRGEQLATLQLTPEELGPVEVRIALREGEATVWFTAQAGETRAALEQALPRLRELFAASGLALSHAGVQSETPRDPQRSTSGARLARSSREGAEARDDAMAGATPLRRGLLDLYA